MLQSGGCRPVDDVIENSPEMDFAGEKTAPELKIRRASGLQMMR
jgi:hypothetical protein